MDEDALRRVRDGLLEVHRELLHAARVDQERLYGRMTAGDLLQATVGDLRFDWLRPLSQLASDIDAALAGAPTEVGDAERAALAGRARALLAPPDPGTAFGARYLRALQEEPGVGVAHGRVAALLR